MIGNTSSWAVRVFSVFLVGCCTSVLTQAQVPVHYSGLINDFSPSTTKGGPWEIRGAWALDLHGESGRANFSAALTMETSDYGITEGAVDPTNPLTRTPHTHDIALTDATVTFDATGCPTTSSSPASTTGFKIYGTVSIMTGNGQRAPFEPKPPLPPTSTLTVCVTGGSDVRYENVTLQFGTPASNHFGTQPIHGVVLQATQERDHDD